MIEPERDQAQGDAQVTAAFSQAKREQVARAICCPQGCQYLGDSEDGNTCYCDTSDLRGSKIERATDAVLAALSALERGGWQPIETAPKQIVRTFGENEYGESILLYAGEIIRGRWWQDARASWRNEGYQNFVIDGGRAVHPTHWMPLPAPPSIVAEK